MFIDLTELPSGVRYEDRYGAYLKIFEDIAHTPPPTIVSVQHPPWSWVPLLEHLCCDINEPRKVFDHCQRVQGAMRNSPLLDRTDIEVLCSYRPETADALWKCDMQWTVPRGRVQQYPPTDQFIVTTNGAFHRPEVKEYMRLLRHYTPTKRKVVLVPCAADKPYPSEMHKAVLERMPEDYYCCIATGVLGLVPQDLWPFMPHYDSGIPNQWYLYKAIKNYFGKFPHERVVSYCDFYASTIWDAFKMISLNRSPREQATAMPYMVIPPLEYNDYLDLLETGRLGELEFAMRNV